MKAQNKSKLVGPAVSGFGNIVEFLQKKFFRPETLHQCFVRCGYHQRIGYAGGVKWSVWQHEQSELIWPVYSVVW